MPRAESRFEYGGDSLLLLAVATVEHQLIGILISEQPESNQENLEFKGGGTSRLHGPAAKSANHASFRLD